jgi:predicted RNase H-like HicB family nuclease
MSQTYLVTAQWDTEAGVWVATSEDIVGLVSEAASLDALYARVLEIAPDLLEENGIAAPEQGTIDFHVLAAFDQSAAE